LAWGKVGHGIVAEIAFSFLDDNTKASVQKYLGTTTIEQASTWMDEVRSDHTYDYMKTWHYVDFDKGKQYEPTKEGNIINALDSAIYKLEHRANMSNDDIKTNLMMVFHLVGDLHMPLHIGYGQDKGGNTIKVKYLGNEVNLHRVWDSEIIESEKITMADCLAQMQTLSKKEIAAYKKVNVVSWMEEPRSLLDQVYDFKDNNIDQAYINKNKPVVEKQLLIAGIRLSAVLTEIFKS
jgi:hypothetical protein